MAYIKDRHGHYIQHRLPYGCSGEFIEDLGSTSYDIRRLLVHNLKETEGGL